MAVRLVVGGWVLVRPVPTPDWLTGVRLPRLLTVSDCIQDDLPRPEAWLGDWFHNEASARAAAATVAGERPHVVALALEHGMARNFRAEWSRDDVPWFDVLRREQPLAPDSTVLGFEVIGAEACLDLHSWHCHDYAEEVRRELGVALDGNGLIPTLDEARAVLTWILARPGERAPAPVPWTVVALVTAPDAEHA